MMMMHQHLLPPSLSSRTACGSCSTSIAVALAVLEMTMSRESCRRQSRCRVGFSASGSS